MWGLKKKKAIQAAKEIDIARAQQDRAERVIAHVDSQETEVTEIVTRLQRRERLNHFGEALMIAMERKE